MEITSTHNLSVRTEHPLAIIERILRDRQSIWRQIRDEDRLNAIIGQMLTTSLIALAGYGIVLGLSNGLLQALASAIKMPLLFLLTLAICMPTLYYFNLVFGARLSIRQALALVMVAISVTAVLAFSFAPISLFFMVTAQDYEFYKLLNVAILTLTGVTGLGFLLEGMRSLNKMLSEETLAGVAAPTEANAEAPVPARPAVPVKINMNLLYIWVLLYGFVGTQLAWTLRPFFGDPNQPFEIFRQIQGNFYVNIFWTILTLFS
jgi:hypothetical protein